MKRIRILLADDHTLVGDGFRKLLAPEFEVVGTVGRWPRSAKSSRRVEARPGFSGCRHTDSDVAVEALRIGASGYLPKNSRGDEFLRAVRDVVKGMSYVTPQIRRAMEERFIVDPRSACRPRHLTPRHREILQMLAEGHSHKEIASILKISIRTVQFHKYEIMKAPGIASNPEVVQYAIKHSLVPPP